MRTTTARRRGLRALLATAGLVATATLMPAAPAQAGFQDCFPVDSDGVLKVICIPYAIDPWPGPDWFEIIESPVLPPEVEQGYLDAVGQGLTLLGAAAVQRDPAAVQALRDRAQDQFLSAAAMLGDAHVELGEVGIIDASGRLEPAPVPWRLAFGTDLVAGLSQFQEALLNPDPTPYVAAGTRAFDSAFAHLASGA